VTDLRVRVKAHLRKWPKKLKEIAKKLLKPKAKTKSRAKKPRKRRKTAKDFGDDPKIRRKYGEAAKTHAEEPWETRYAREKRRKRQ